MMRFALRALRNACALVAQPLVAFRKALFRLTTAIAIVAQRLCLCTPRGNNFLDLFPCAVKRGDASSSRRCEGAYRELVTEQQRHGFPHAVKCGEGLQICAEHGRFADATLLSVNERGEYR